jgi:hypothetical protein
VSSRGSTRYVVHHVDFTRLKTSNAQGEWVQAEVACQYEGGAICIKVDLHGAKFVVLQPGLPALSVARKYWQWRHKNGHPLSSNASKEWTTSEPTDPVKLFIRLVRYVNQPERDPCEVYQLSLVRKHRYWPTSTELSSFFRPGFINNTAIACSAEGEITPNPPRQRPVVRRAWV